MAFFSCLVVAMHAHHDAHGSSRPVSFHFYSDLLPMIPGFF